MDRIDLIDLETCLSGSPIAPWFVNKNMTPIEIVGANGEYICSCQDIRTAELIVGLREKFPEASNDMQQLAKLLYSDLDLPDVNNRSEDYRLGFMHALYYFRRKMSLYLPAPVPTASETETLATLLEEDDF